MKFSPEFIEKVRDASNIVDTISQHTSLKQMGHNLMGLCPFPDHKEKTPSFSVSETKQVYYCFGCKKSGNIINFLMDYNGMSFLESIEFLAQKSSIPLPENVYTESSSQSQKPSLFKINLLAGAYFKNELQKLSPAHPAKVYLKNRGLTEDTISTFKLGYSQDAWSDLTQYFTSKKVPLKLAQALGLIKNKKNSSEYFDLFRNRIMFPILSPKGDVVGFGGRTISDENPKYLNSPESDVFKKGQILYGLNESAKYIKTEDQVIIVEGYMDLIMLYQHGFKNVVATLGTAFTDGHAKLLRRYTRNAIVLFDNDSAGNFAQERSLPVLLSHEFLPKAISLGEAKDPDEFLNKFGAEKLKSQIRSANDLFFVILDRVFKTYRDTPTEKVNKLEQASSYILSTKDKSLRDLYIQELAMRLNVKLDWITSGIQKLYQDNLKANLRSVPERKENVKESHFVEKIDIKNPLKEEVFLVNLALYKQECMEELLSLGLEDQLTSPGLNEVFKLAAEEYRQNPNDFARLASTLCTRVSDPSVIMKHLDADWETTYDIQKLKSDCLQRVKERYLKLKAATIMQELKADQAPHKLEQFMNVIRNRQSLNKVRD